MHSFETVNRYLLCQACAMFPSHIYQTDIDKLMTRCQFAVPDRQLYQSAADIF